jgi:prepilin-type N-terminal cleavage/methylation domain-containing protein
MNRSTQRRGAGFTLTEALVALAIFALLLVTVGHFTVGSVRAYRAALQLLERSQITALAEEVVLQEIGLAGYGLAPAAGGPAAATVEISVNPQPDRSDSIRVHYLEERWLAAPQLQEITIDVVRDSNGNPNLYRRQQGATRQPAVQGVTNLKLFRFIDESGQQTDPAAGWPQRIGGLVLRLSFDWDAERFVVIQFGVPQRLGAL